MRVDTKEVNPALQMIIENPDETVFLDANFMIPPDRSKYKNIKPFPYERFKENWLKPLLEEFSGLGMHESVLKELVSEEIKSFIEEQSCSKSPRIKISYDKDLKEEERVLMNSYINRIAVHSQYDPSRDNTKDRGEVRTLSFMAVKKFLYFAANDALPIRLIKNAEELKTGLDDMKIVQMYELIYYLYKTGKYNNKELRVLYKYQYYLTSRDKRDNPEWGKFIESMDELYANCIK